MLPLPKEPEPFPLEEERVLELFALDPTLDPTHPELLPVLFKTSILERFLQTDLNSFVLFTMLPFFDELLYRKSFKDTREIYSDKP